MFGERCKICLLLRIKPLTSVRGCFTELEVVLREGESAEAGVREAEELMKRLGVKASHLIDRAYVDLLVE
jgi:adenylate cyclase class IV